MSMFHIGGTLKWVSSDRMIPIPFAIFANRNELYPINLGHDKCLLIIHLQELGFARLGECRLPTATFGIELRWN